MLCTMDVWNVPDPSHKSHQDNNVPGDIYCRDLRGRSMPVQLQMIANTKFNTKFNAMTNVISPWTSIDYD